jgi:hypothetical protein
VACPRSRWNTTQLNWSLLNCNHFTCLNGYLEAEWRRTLSGGKPPSQLPICCACAVVHKLHASITRSIGFEFVVALSYSHAHSSLSEFSFRHNIF